MCDQYTRDNNDFPVALGVAKRFFLSIEEKNNMTDIKPSDSYKANISVHFSSAEHLKLTVRIP